MSGPKEHALPRIVLQHAAFKIYALHKVYEFVERITRGKLCGVQAIQSKDASGPKEHARHGIGPPALRV